MISLKHNICSVPVCGLQLSDITGFKDINNPLGFFRPGVDTAAVAKEYYIDDVYLFTYVIKNNPDNTFENVAFAGNTGKLVVYDDVKTFSEMMNLAGEPQTLNMSEDGYFSIYHFGIPKESIINEPRASAPLAYYVKPTGLVYTMVNGVETLVDPYTLIMSNPTWGNTNISVIKTELVSKCYLDACLSYILEKFAKNYTAADCIKNKEELNRLRETRDLLFAISNTIQYYVEFGYYYKAAKLIENAGFCSICASFVKQSFAASNCNCNG